MSAKCRICLIEKEESQFYKNYLKNYNYICIDCQKIKDQNKPKKYRTCPICQTKFCVYGPVKECSIKCRIINNTTKDDNNCWNWNLAFRNNLPTIVMNKKKLLAHHVSYNEFKTTIQKQDIIHRKCNNKKCLNPDHMWVETLSNFSKRTQALGNSQIGENNWQAKLNEKKVKEIIQLRREGQKYKEIAEQFGIHPSHARALACKIWWKHLHKKRDPQFKRSPYSFHTH